MPKAKKKVKKKAKRRLSDEQKVKILKKFDELVSSGKKGSEAAKEVGVPYINIYNWKKASGKKPAGKRGRPAKKAKVAKKGRKPGKKRGRKPGKKAAKRGRPPGKAKKKRGRPPKASTGKVARKLTGEFILRISGPSTQIERPISAEVVSEIVKMVF